MPATNDNVLNVSQSHPEEYASIMRQLQQAEVEIDMSRPGNFAYGPQTGGPGKIILDPDASIAALRHEFQHFLDHQAMNFPGYRPFYENPKLFADFEINGYNQEIEIAKATGNEDLIPQIIEQMQKRIRELLGR